MGAPEEPVGCRLVPRDSPQDGCGRHVSFWTWTEIGMGLLCELPWDLLYGAHVTEIIHKTYYTCDFFPDA